MKEIETLDGKVRTKQYLRADVEKQIIKCPNCSKDIIRRDLRQIVYYCSSECRLSYRKGK